MELTFSAHLASKKPLYAQIIGILSHTWDYVSILATDVRGTHYECNSTGVTIHDSMWNERGLVVRVQHAGEVAEYALNHADDMSAEALADQISGGIRELHMGSRGIPRKKYPTIRDVPWKERFAFPPRKNPLEQSPEEIIRVLQDIRAKTEAAVPTIINVTTMYQWNAISKLFLSPERDLEQVYTISQGYITAIARKGDRTRRTFFTFSGRKAGELLEEMTDSAEQVAHAADELLEAEPVPPGVYDIICAPDVSGTIAHESFGHGVETDMFVKGRAKAEGYLGKRVAASGVDLHDGAAAAEQVASFAFDDEGNPARDTLVIRDGMFVSGISDELSALELGIEPTGNGRRQAFDHKAYARMTNTYFSGGNATLEDMIASISHGYLVDRMTSGMEDPKNWGIQLVALIGREIRDGKLTGEVVSPLYISGYVPEVLGSISMISPEVELFGSGYCGKGHKELARVSSGGPYMKLKARLG